MSPGSLQYRWVWTLPASPESLWPLVSNTDRFNRDTGLPIVEALNAPGRDLDNARRLLRFSVAGVTVEWEELPFEWVRPRRFGVVRRYHRGPLREMWVVAELDPVGEGTRLTYSVGATPRGVLGHIAGAVQLGLLSRRRFGAVFRAYAEKVRAFAAAEGATRGKAASAAAPRLPEAAPPARGGDPDATRRLVEAGVPADVSRALVAHVSGGDELTLQRIRPYALAELWELPRRRVLDACLRATRAGLLDLQWDVLCPLCRGPKVHAATLSALRAGEVHCEACLTDFSVSFDRSVELSFTPNPGFRRVPKLAFCVAGPQVTPHILVQQLLPPGDVREVSPLLEDGCYRVRAIGLPGELSLRVGEGGGEELDVALPEGSWPEGETVVAGLPLLRIRNPSRSERLVVLERTEWLDDVVTAAEVTAMREFRDLFASEVFAAGEFLSVGSVAVLFTDLKGSTRMYRDVGDAPAFGRVMRHFQVLEDAIRAEDGILVKTIGDAVMAVFPTRLAALRAALSSHAGLDNGAAGESLILKTAVHHGPCLAVTLNDRLDYFGTTVNVAARLAGLSQGGDVVISEAVRSDPEVAEALRQAGARVVPVEASLKGLENEAIALYRVELPEPLAG